MVFLKRLLPALALVFLASAAAAQVCGTRSVPETGFVARDNWSCSTGGVWSLEQGAQFWRACRAHDVCYFDPTTSKAFCDDRLLGNLRFECKAAFPSLMGEPCHQACASTALLYYGAVEGFAGGLFDESKAQGSLALRMALDREPDLKNLTPEKQSYFGRKIGEGCFTWQDADGNCLPGPAAVYATNETLCNLLHRDSADCRQYRCEGYPRQVAVTDPNGPRECIETCEKGIPRQICR